MDMCCVQLTVCVNVEESNPLRALFMLLFACLLANAVVCNYFVYKSTTDAHVLRKHVLGISVSKVGRCCFDFYFTLHSKLQ